MLPKMGKGFLPKRTEERQRDKFPFNLLSLACKPLATKIIFLGGSNIETLKAYKAVAELHEGLDANHQEIHITLTGFSKGEGKFLFDQLKPMSPEEIHEADPVQLLKDKGFTFTQEVPT